MRKNTHIIILTVLSLWLMALIFATRHYMLDDALIHLNYARYLHDNHIIAFDGVHPSFGTSSLVYVSLLALLRSFTTTAMLSKIVSVCAFLLLVVSMLRVFFRMSAGSIGRVVMAGVVAASCSAMGLRWLADGMETSLSLWAVLMLCCIVWSEMQSSSTSMGRACGLILFGLFATLLRIEYAMLLALSCLAILVVRRTSSSKISLVVQVARASYLGLGAVVAELLIFAHFKSFLPDTALAKSKHYVSIDPFIGVMLVLTSSFELGVGTLLVWLLSAAASFADMRKRPSAVRSLPIWLIVNCSFPLFAILACARSQSMQGVRYVLWAILFSTFLNAFQLADAQRSQIGWFGKAAVSIACLMLLMLPVDTYLGLRCMISRGHNFVAMRDAHLDSFAGREIVAGDVGFVGYFTRGVICDTNGLVNGRAMAVLSAEKRIQFCIANHPDGVFMNAEQAILFNRYLPIGNWKICKAIDFENISRHDWHYLATPDEKLCPKTEANVQTMSQVVPGLQ